MQNEMDVVSDFSERLGKLGIPFMLTGSMAMSFYARPRMTRDIDLVVDLKPENVPKLVAAFEADYYVSASSVHDAVRQRSQFNLIHLKSVIKVDCIVRKNSEHALAEFERRRGVTAGEVKTTIVAKEDLILAKLSCARKSESDIQLTDVRTCWRRDMTATSLKPGPPNSGSATYGRNAPVSDTSPEVQELYQTLLMRLSNEERFIRGALMFDAAREMVLASLPKDLPPDELLCRLYERFYGEPLPPDFFKARGQQT